MPKARAYSVQEQFGWDELPAELSEEQLAAAGVSAEAVAAEADAHPAPAAADHRRRRLQQRPVRRAAAALVGRACLHQPVRSRRPRRRRSAPPSAATCASPQVGTDYDTHHVVLDFGSTPFPVLEGQSIGIVPPGVDAEGRPHHPRQY